MSISAANSAGLLNVSLCPRAWTNQSLIDRNVANHCRRSFRGDASSSRTAICLDFGEPSADENFVLKRVCRFVSRLMLGHRFGATPAPGGTRSSASHCAPLWGHGSSQNKFAKYNKERLQTSFGPLPESRPSALGSQAHSLASLHVTQATTGEFNKRRHSHVSEQSNAHRFPRQQPRSSHQQSRRQRHESFAGNQILLQKERRVCLAHGVAPLRRVRQAVGVRQDAHEGRTCPA